jgi:hypothetical protein
VCDSIDRSTPKHMPLRILQLIQVKLSLGHLQRVYCIYV